ncbi:MAG: GDSL-type esterase/lipase family protein [Acidobacteriota bacterium]
MSRLSRKIRTLALGLMISLTTFEVLARVLFPLADLPHFNRLGYANAGAGAGGANLAHRTLWWWSEPDGTSFTRQLNLYGFHDRQWRLSKRRGTRRVAFIGDSFVEGYGAPGGATLTAEFEHFLRRRGDRVEALNLGAGGFGLDEYLALARDAVSTFRPDDLVLVLYMNDVYRIPEAPETLLTGEPDLGRTERWKPRLIEVVRRLRSGHQMPLRWHRPASATPTPLAIEPRLAADPQLVKNIHRFVEPEIAESMLAGRLNPAITNLLRRSERVLVEPVDLSPVLSALDRFTDRQGTRLWVVFLPSLNQVTDRYLPEQRRMSGPIAAETLTAPAFQRHARDLASTCQRLAVPFLDLTPALSRAEAEGQRLYWPYDAHMTAAGYSVVGRKIADWWLESGNRDLEVDF